jgi:CheY-like chemotaxis protein
MAKILVAASSEPREILQRMLAGHELACPASLAQAERLLQERPFDLILCTVFFDESRMFDLLRLAKSKAEWARIPFVCARLRRHVLDALIAREGVAFTCRALGAVAYLDVADYGADPDREMRAAIERVLDGVSPKDGR